MAKSSGAKDALAARVAGVETVLFDLDGTLIDTVDLIRASMRYATEQVLGAALPDDVLMKNVGVPLIVQMREFDASQADELVRVYRQHNSHVHDAMVREYPGVEETLEDLVSKGHRLGVVTSKSREVAMRGIERFSLGRFFDAIVAADDVPLHKPDPYPLIEAARQLGSPTEGCAYVGDSPHDMTAAINAGCLAIAALWGAFLPEHVLAPGPSHAASRITDLVPLLFDSEECYRV